MSILTNTIIGLNIHISCLIERLVKKILSRMTLIRFDGHQESLYNKDGGIQYGRKKKIDKAFKEQAVIKILSGEATVSSMAKELEAHYSTVRDWPKI